jgi:hypothetical protein
MPFSRPTRSPAAILRETRAEGLLRHPSLRPPASPSAQLGLRSEQLEARRTAGFEARRGSRAHELTQRGPVAADGEVIRAPPGTSHPWFSRQSMQGGGADDRSVRRGRVEARWGAFGGRCPSETAPKGSGGSASETRLRCPSERPRRSPDPGATPLGAAAPRGVPPGRPTAATAAPGRARRPGRTVGLYHRSSTFIRSYQPLRSKTGLQHKKVDGLNFGLELS